MSSANPPYPYYNGIPFNPSFFKTDTSSGLTETAANALYLRKTVADTATAQETFTSGIITQGNSTIGTVGSGTLTINRPITIGYSVQPTSGQIGHTTYLTINNSTNATNYYLFSASIPAANATYMCNWNFQYVLTSNATLNQPQLYLPSDPSLSNGTVNLGPIPLIGQPTYYTCNGSRTFYSGATSSMGIQLLWLPQNTASAFSGYGSCTLTRIA